MAETTEGIPSNATKHLIRTATGKGHKAVRAVLVFTTTARQAIRAFDNEVNPLHLPDEHYEAVEESSGLHELLTLAADVEAVLTGLLDRGA